MCIRDRGSYYHTKKTCGGMKNAAQTTLRWALDHNYKRCKDCNLSLIHL